MRRLLFLLLLLSLTSCAPRLPSPPAPEPAAPPLTLLDHGRFRLWYDCQRGEPHRFAFTLWKDQGHLQRIDNFRIDRSLPEGCRGQFSAKAYSTPKGYHRGHLAANNHFDDDRVAMDASNLMSNIVPQLASHNSRTWYQTELLTECYRDLHPVTVIGGVVFGHAGAALDNDAFVTSHGIATPEVFWKVLLTEDDQGKPQVIAWWIPHQAGLGTDLDPYLRSVREIEALLGPGEAPIEVPEALKDQRPVQTWPIPAGCDRQ
ncbi:DNA/RNA non-specific endonuclease [Pseudomonas mosselii]|uniref:DNA/RNA non-specific endonuclease n=1 Tax=unclassified Pseudomonas TaxID=196821 RepID=UPI001F178B21|nr:MULTISPECIES: DNA/RNA non-specific endonuclease [unclassified Pseudomonas]MCF1489428.1 DNA/RNA non-specific endonuclease [Pseudomonas sp. AA27]MCP8633322.1 DNA/RNA non-specific endonuclease [Pseudomonas sp. DVZ6]MDD7782827.1 DNA/RNA non-specific endonuclease [Pseudomonas sp. DVZ24]